MNYFTWEGSNLVFIIWLWPTLHFTLKILAEMQVHNQFILVRGGEKRTAPVTTMRATKVFALCLLAFCKAKSQWLEQKYQLQQHGMKEFSYLTFYFKTKKYKILLFRKLFIDCVLRCGKLATLKNLFWATFTFKLEFKASLTMFVVNSVWSTK